MQGIVKSLNDNRGLDFIEVEDHKRRYFRVRSEIMCAVVFAGPVAITAPVLAWVFLVY